VRSEVTITLTPQGTGTDLLIRHTRLTQPGAAERHAAGWEGAVDQLIVLVSEALERSHSRSPLEGSVE
jgi:hypothetical protein